MFREHGHHPGRAVREEQGRAQAARAPRPLGPARRPVRRAHRHPAVYPGRAQEHRRRAVLPPDHRPDAHRAVRVRYLHQLPADRAPLADDHQQGQDMPLFTVNSGRRLSETASGEGGLEVAAHFSIETENEFKLLL